MNILIINKLISGGAAKACLRLHKALQDQEGIESKLLVLNSDEVIYNSENLYENKYKYILLEGLNKINRKFKNTLNRIDESYTPFSYPRSIHNVESHELIKWADLINLHWVSNFIDYKEFFLKVNKPIIWTLHDMEPFTGGFHYREKFDLIKHEKLLKNNINTKKLGINKNKPIIVPLNKWMENESKKSELFAYLNHVVIPNTIDKSVFVRYDKDHSRDILGIGQNEKVILFIAERIDDKRKGIKYLVEADSIINEDISLLIIGQNEVELISKHKIYFKGRVDSDEFLSICYSAADLFVIPSIEDNLPNTILESLMCGTPVIGFDVGGVSEMISDGKNGLLCKNVSGSSLANSIICGLNINFDNKKIRRDAVEYYGNEVIASKYKELARTIIEGLNK